MKKINLTGDAVARGTMHIKPLNTTYELQNDTIHFLVNEIRFSGDTLRDRNGNVGVFNGSLYHQHLSRLTYAFNSESNYRLCICTLDSLDTALVEWIVGIAIHE